MRILSLFVIYIIFISKIIGQYNINGTILNENGERIEFASVFLLETNYAAVTGSDGKYIIEDITPGKYILKVTFLGYEPQTKEISVSEDLKINITLQGTIYQLDKIEILGNRVDDSDAFTYTQVENGYLEAVNNGQDLPYALRLTPSVVVTSDAGAGIGYTGIRIRGTDATRVNVTINGIPLNDAESQGVFWVDLPDFISSTENIQIQRGVGTSTTGVGAFGGSVSLNTLKTHINPYISAVLGAGSYDTKRLSLKLGTGLINDHYSFDARYSRITSDGYIDRATSDLYSLYFSASRISENNSLRLLAFSGHEVTYQSWYGSPQARVEGGLSALQDHYFTNQGSLYFTPQDSLNLFSSDRRYNYYQYDNQVDDYRQTHIQLHSHNKVGQNWLLNGSIFYIKGKGFFEEFKIDQDLLDYNISGGGSSNLVRRRWLNNDYFGMNLNATHNLGEETEISMGAHLSKYIGDHYGRVINISSGAAFTRGEDYYFNQGNKSEQSAFLKLRTNASKKLSILADAQLRNINYEIAGDDNDGLDLEIDEQFTFLNPKVGLHYQLNDQNQLYTSYALAYKEPNRSDFVDRLELSSPKQEQLRDFELGYRYNTSNWASELIYYNMRYKDQLVLTGALNDVGSPLRTNVENSSRIGIEMIVSVNLNSKLVLDFNTTLSKNKIESFSEIIYDYTTGFDEEIVEHIDSDIAFSPSTIAGLGARYELNEWLQLGYQMKYVGKQFLDNTSNSERSLSAYNVHDLVVNIEPHTSFAKKMKASIEIRNLWNMLYSSNGYTYSYRYVDLVTENFLYPQAERNIMINLSIDL